jgi:hypothetical protein
MSIYAALRFCRNVRKGPVPVNTPLAQFGATEYHIFHEQMNGKVAYPHDWHDYSHDCR